MRSITESFTALGFFAKPTPMIAVEMLCVVETGMPSLAATSRMVAEAVSAAKPLIGCSLIILSCALVMAAGTAMGGWRIIRTLGHKMVKLHPINGFAAETASATILLIAAKLGMPVSTTHSISTAIMGVGFAKNPNALKLTVIERIVWAWLLTIPAAGGIAWLLVTLLKSFGLAGL